MPEDTSRTVTIVSSALNKIAYGVAVQGTNGEKIDVGLDGEYSDYIVNTKTDKGNTFHEIQFAPSPKHPRSKYLEDYSIKLTETQMKSLETARGGKRILIAPDLKMRVQPIANHILKLYDPEASTVTCIRLDPQVTSADVDSSAAKTDSFTFNVDPNAEVWPETTPKALELSNVLFEQFYKQITGSDEQIVDKKAVYYGHILLQRSPTPKPSHEELVRVKLAALKGQPHRPSAMRDVTVVAEDNAEDVMREILKEAATQSSAAEVSNPGALCITLANTRYASPDIRFQSPYYEQELIAIGQAMAQNWAAYNDRGIHVLVAAGMTGGDHETVGGDATVLTAFAREFERLNPGKIAPVVSVTDTNTCGAGGMPWGIDLPLGRNISFALNNPFDFGNWFKEDMMGKIMNGQLFPDSSNHMMVLNGGPTVTRNVLKFFVLDPAPASQGFTSSMTNGSFGSSGATCSIPNVTPKVYLDCLIQLITDEKLGLDNHESPYIRILMTLAGHYNPVTNAINWDAATTLEDAIQTATSKEQIANAPKYLELLESMDVLKDYVTFKQYHALTSDGHPIKLSLTKPESHKGLGLDKAAVPMSDKDISSIAASFIKAQLVRLGVNAELEQDSLLSCIGTGQPPLLVERSGQAPGAVLPIMKQVNNPAKRP